MSAKPPGPSSRNLYGKGSTDELTPAQRRRVRHRLNRREHGRHKRPRYGVPHHETGKGKP